MKIKRDFHQISVLLSLFYALNLLHQAIGSEVDMSNNRITLYNPAIDKNIELLFKDTFDKVIQNSQKCTIVELFAHWCGSCQRAAPHWKLLSNETSLWKNVIRVAALDCALPENREICTRVDVKWYPTFRLFPALKEDMSGSLFEVKDVADKESFMRKMIEFIESHQEKPKHWPELTPLRSDELSNLFLGKQRMKYAVVILENDDSYDGRKVILDFSQYVDRLIVARITPNSNPTLYKRMSSGFTKIDQPFAILVTNTPQGAIFEALENVVNKQKTRNRREINSGFLSYLI